MRKWILYSITLLALFLFEQCSSTIKTTNQENFSYMYSGDQTALHPQFEIYNFSADSSTIYFRITSKELLFSRVYNDSTFNAALKVQYLVRRKGDEHYIDSATIQFTQSTLNKSKRWLVGKFNIGSLGRNIYQAHLKLIDINRNHSYSTYLRVDRTNKNNRQNYIVLNKAGRLLFNNILNNTDTVNIVSNHPLDKVYIRYYSREFPAALPPFVKRRIEQFNIHTSDVMVMNLHHKDTLRFYAEKEGIYHLQTDTNQTAGLSLFNFGEQFPYLKTYNQMSNSLRYLTSQKEYNELTEPTGNKQKIALDSFWLKIGGTYKRSRKVMEKYYQLVENANQYFTSYQPGWRTDRGLIYIVYGPPNIIYQSKNGQKWIYGQLNSHHSKAFVFMKVPNPFTNNDYALDRSVNYKHDWFRSVQLWRDGRVFN